MASIFGRAARCAEQTNPASLVNNIMQYTSINPSIPALNWRRNNEDQARAVYVSSMKDQHRNFSVAKSGLCLHFEYPHLGATQMALCHVIVVEKDFLRLRVHTSTVGFLANALPYPWAP